MAVLSLDPLVALVEAEAAAVLRPIPQERLTQGVVEPVALMKVLTFPRRVAQAW